MKLPGCVVKLHEDRCGEFGGISGWKSLIVIRIRKVNIPLVIRCLCLSLWVLIYDNMHS